MSESQRRPLGAGFTIAPPREVVVRDCAPGTMARAWYVYYVKRTPEGEHKASKAVVFPEAVSRETVMESWGNAIACAPMLNQPL